MGRLTPSQIIGKALLAISIATFAIAAIQIIFRDPETIANYKHSIVHVPARLTSWSQEKANIQNMTMTENREYGHKPSGYFIEQRNRLSRLLNEQKKAFGQQSCKMEALDREKGVSANGGWCAEFSAPDSVEHVLDENFGQALSKFLKGKHVGSFGDGPGAYRKYLESLNQVASYTAYDGAPFCETTTKGWVSFLDLTGPQYGLPAFDWVTSVEVGEHIPREFEDVYLDNLVRHAKEGIILSWAVPGQDGFSHINTRPLKHVIGQMKKRGFNINITEGDSLRKAAERPWLQQNIRVYRRTEPSSFILDDQ